ncbi:MAG: ABC transporter permease [Anaerolineae bacterium]|jgi:putative ABC transport system permease protein|nr:ABC transporter permease [Anaerolineae bacterium]
MNELLTLAIGNLLRARARLVMTAGGVLVGTAAVILLISITVGLQEAAEKDIGQNASLTEMQVYPAYNPNLSFDQVPRLDLALVRRLYTIPNVAMVIPTVYMEGGGELVAGKLYGYGSIQGIEPSLIPYLGLEAAQGAVSLEPGQVLVGSLVGANFFDPNAEEYTPVEVDMYNTPITLTVYQYSGENPQSRKVKLDIAGVLAPNPSYDYAIMMPIRDVLAYNEFTSGNAFDPETFQFANITVRATSRETTLEVSEAIRDLGYEVSGMVDFLNQLNQFFGTMRLMLGAVGSVALLVAAFGVANTMTMAILERTKEIGLMKAIGATDRDVMTIFLIEAGMVGFSGGAAGVLLSYFLQNLANTAIRNLPAGDGSGGAMFLPINPELFRTADLLVIPPELTLFAMGLATAVGVVSGLLPALRAARMTPVLALKAE